jgi:NAD(P)-dependent dehydrogenase (short-subunit alcohol dehydrogenase family)
MPLDGAPELEGRVGLITGAAGSIGAAIARSLSARGARLVLADRHHDQVERLASELGADDAVWIAGDAGDSAHVRAAVALATERFGGLDIAVANAGVFGVIAPIAEYPEETFAEVMRVNVGGSFLLCKHALPVIREGGTVIITSSVVGLTSDPGICAYASSKHALVGLMRTAMKEAAPRAIRVNTIHPGPTDNDFQHAIEMTATGLDQAAASAAFERMIPLGRHATPDEVAGTVAFLAGPGGAFITGATIAVDGGMSV